ncbi:hypothetical protein KEJ14_04080 [Candidatus Bathyarchaeota archaeon]|nr:hypothetical protein [Candidatus Bathyarchaeota archaeon]
MNLPLNGDFGLLEMYVCMGGRGTITATIGGWRPNCFRCNSPEFFGLEANPAKGTLRTI